MADLKVYYNGEKIAATSSSGKKVLKTQGLICSTDITVEYLKPVSDPRSYYGEISRKGSVTGGSVVGSYSSIWGRGVSEYYYGGPDYRDVLGGTTVDYYSSIEELGESEYDNILVCTGHAEVGPVAADSDRLWPESEFGGVEYDPQ